MAHGNSQEAKVGAEQQKENHTLSYVYENCHNVNRKLILKHFYERKRS